MIGPKVKIEDMSSERIIMEKQYSMEIIEKLISRKRILCSETMPSGLTEPKRVMAKIQHTAQEDDLASYFEDEVLDNSNGSGTRNRVFWVSIISRKMGLRQVEQGTVS